MLVTDAERASCRFGGFGPLFCEIRGPFTAFFGDDDPAVKKIILTKFIIVHKLTPAISFVV